MAKNNYHTGKYFHYISMEEYAKYYNSIERYFKYRDIILTKKQIQKKSKLRI